MKTVVRSVRPHLLGKTILQVSLSSRRVTRADHQTTAAGLTGATILDIQRQGKQIWFHLDRGLLYVHLGMTGKLLWDAPTGRHTRASLQFEDGLLVYDDTRMFGRFEFFSEPPLLSSRIGPDALTVGAEEFFSRMQQHRGAVKTLLLNQRFICGVGNIYADEALFAAGIHPRTSARRISLQRATRLHRHLLQILQLAIQHRGSSIADYVDGEGRAGSFQQLHNVYGRHGETCLRCRTPIRRIVLGQRGTHYCPRCQRV